eukprot:TRINITY_DN4518_c0_g1_i2.p1 TRINITY_DN4518_c0_g1~~TRINITY_DN4518_c0_g1_i2.p1  ORF type:complete len:204 (-),score=59.24 TRINITY_DN4518_c0_g1_i2:48-659(-)
MAPEVLANDQYYGKSCDVFSFGVTVCELLHGNSPFADKLTTELLAEHSDPRGKVMLSNLISKEARSFLTGVMEPNPEKRLGCGKEGWEEVKRHPWFKSISWEAVSKKEVRPPFVPSSANYGAENFENTQAMNEELLRKPPVEIPEKYQKDFVGIEYNVDLANLDKAAAELDEQEASKSQLLKPSSSPKQPLLKPEGDDYKSMQ